MMTPSNLENSTNMSVANLGYADEVPIALEMWRAYNSTRNAPISGVTTPTLEKIMSTRDVINFAAAATASTPIEFDWNVPEWYAESQKALQLIVRARKYDTGGDENALSFNLTVSWQNTTETIQTLTTIPTAVIATAQTAATAAGFADYTLDIGARLRAESKIIKAGGWVHFSLAPSTTVGTSDQALQVIATKLRLKRHSSLLVMTHRSI